MQMTQDSTKLLYIHSQEVLNCRHNAAEAVLVCDVIRVPELLASNVFWVMYVKFILGVVESVASLLITIWWYLVLTLEKKQVTKKSVQQPPQQPSRLQNSLFVHIAAVPRNNFFHHDLARRSLFLSYPALPKVISAFVNSRLHSCKSLSWSDIGELVGR